MRVSEVTRLTKGEQTRSRIVAAASEAFERDGFGGAGLSSILDASGAPRGSLYFHFPGGKEQLAVAAIEAALAELLPVIKEMLRGARTASHGVIRMLRLLSDRLEASGFEIGCPLCSIVSSSASAPESVRRAAAKAVGTIEHSLAAHFIDHGRSGRDAKRLATVVLSTIEGAILLARVQRRRDPLDRVAKALPQLLLDEP